MIPKKPGRKSYVITSIVLLLLVTGYVFYKIKKKDFLDHRLAGVVKQKTHQLYNITYDSVSVNELGGDLYIKNIYIKGDTARQLELIKNSDTNATAAIFDIFIPMLKVVNFKTARALLTKQLECRQIVISNPQVRLYLFPGQGKQTDNREKQEELYKQLLGNFKLIKADSVSVVNAEVSASDFFTKELKFRTFKTTVNLSGVAIDSTYSQDTSRTLFCKEIGIKSDKIIFGDKKNTAEASFATFDTRSKIVAFSSISYDAFKNNGFFKTKLQGILVTGIEWLGPVENSDLIIDRAVINRGELETLLVENKDSKSNEKKEGRILTGWIKKFSLKSLQVKSVNFIGRTTAEKKKPFQVKNNSFSIKNINIDRTAAFNGKLISQAKEIELYNDEISIKSADNMYEYKVSGIRLNSKTKSILIKSFRVIPQLDEGAFAKKSRYQTDRYNIAIKDVKCSNVDVEKLLKGEVNIESINTIGSSVKVFRDLSYPIDSISKHGQQMSYPHQIIHKLGIPIKISKCLMADTYIEYKEKNAISHNSGRVRFANTALSLKNISTHKPREGEKTVVSFKTNFLDEIPLTGGFTFSLDQWQKGVFSAEASITNSIDATIFNQLTEPMAMIKVEKGEIYSVKFSMKADTNTSNATLVIPYENLKVSLLKKKGDEYTKKGILSLLANLAVKNNNKEGNNMRTAHVLITRNEYRSFFDFIWTTVSKGLKDVAVKKL
jgi:hypothetical protein